MSAVADVVLWARRVAFGMALFIGATVAVSTCGGCGASVSEYEAVTQSCAERAAVIRDREGTTLEQDRADLQALRAECEAVR